MNGGRRFEGRVHTETPHSTTLSCRGDCSSEVSCRASHAPAINIDLIFNVIGLLIKSFDCGNHSSVGLRSDSTTSVEIESKPNLDDFT
jgi:hypothetical protein